MKTYSIEWHIAFGAHSQIPKCCVKYWIVEIKGEPVPSTFNALYKHYRNADICEGIKNMTGCSWKHCEEGHDRQQIVRKCSRDCQFITDCYGEGKKGEPRTMTRKIKRWKCYGRVGCQNKAPKDGMCLQCSRRKYGAWLDAPISAERGRKQAITSAKYE